jgi:transcriptional regulator with XRE-family HTH domain
MARESIGLRVARWRDIAGMTQQQLADRVAEQLGREHFSQAYISMIENGRRAVDRRPLLLALAHSLGVAVTDLTGQPYPPTARVDLDSYMVVPAIRSALDEPDDPITPRPVHQLAYAADRAMAARMECDFPGLGAHLPGLLTDSRLLWDAGDAEAGRLLVQAAVTGSLMLKPAGWIDLAVRLAELADRVAAQLGDPVCVAAARFALAQCALAGGNRRRSLLIATTAADTLDGAGRSRSGLLNDAVAWMGMLHLHAALTAASLHHADDAEAHLTEAAAHAAQVDGDPWRMEFTAANVDTWRVGVALENGEPERAPELARRVNPRDLHTKQRRARLYLDTGRGMFIAGEPDRAVTALLLADDAAPGDLRNRPSAVEIVAHMVRAAPVRGGSEALRDLAVRVGVDPMSPEPVA